MEYYITPSELKNTFPVPEAVVKKHFKLATETQLRVLLCALCYLEWDFDAQKIAEALSMPAEAVKEALDFWADVKLIGRTAAAPEAAPAKAVAGTTIKPSRAEVAQRGLESPEIVFLLNEAQQKFGRALRQNEASTLVWLYDENGMELSLLLMLLEYAASTGSMNISFIERTALRWINNGIASVADAEQEIVQMNLRRSAYGVVAAAMNLHLPRPSEELLQWSYTWVKEWGYDKEILQKAYDECINNTSEFNLKYIKKVLESWHKSGVKTAADLQNVQKKPAAKPTGGAYKKDRNLFMDEE